LRHQPIEALARMRVRGRRHDCHAAVDRMR
jgi:hypothetical protein